MGSPFADDGFCDDEDSSDLSIPILFGRFLVHEGVIDEDSLERALRVQRELNGQVGCVALEAGVVVPDVWFECRRFQREHAVTFLEAASALGVLGESEFRRLIAVMADAHLYLGEILVRQGSLQPQQLKQLLCAFSGGGI